MNTKLRVADLLKLHAAGGVLDNMPNLGDQTWDVYKNASFDMTDANTVVFVAEWKKFLDAQAEFSRLLRNHAQTNGFVEVVPVTGDTTTVTATVK